MVGRSADLGSRRPWSTVAGVVMVQTRVERSVGRPLLLDRALIRTISASVRKGAFLHVAAEAAGAARGAADHVRSGLNQTTARALGLTIPNALLQQATEVFQ
jgi:hypothetical protein